MSRNDDSKPPRSSPPAAFGARDNAKRPNGASSAGGERTASARTSLAPAVLPRRDLMRYAAMAGRDLLPGLIAKFSSAGYAKERFSPDVTEIMRLLLQGKVVLARDYLQRLRAQGIPTEDIFQFILGGVADRLGEMWLDDRIDFLTVTETTGQLISLMRGMSAGHSSLRDVGNSGVEISSLPHILVLTPQDEDHSFGALMLAEFFRFAGWRVEVSINLAQPEAERLVSEVEFDLIAYSASSRFPLDTIANRLASLRLASQNKKALIAIGGSLLADIPDAASLIGADFGATSAKQAVDEAAKRLTFIHDTAQRESGVGSG